MTAKDEETIATGEDQEEELLGASDTKRYQRCAALLNYFCLDRSDVQFSVKELMRKMSSPNVEDEVRLKRAARYLKGKSRYAMQFKWKPLSPILTVYCDSDFAGCHRTRKSTSEGVAMWGPQLVKTWAKTQAILALSTGEAELASVVKASSEALGLRSLLADLGHKVDI